MTGVVRLEGDDLSAVFNRLDAIQRQVVDLRPAWTRLRRLYSRRADNQWQTLRPRWRPLSPRYTRQVGRRYATLDTGVGRPPKGLRHAPGQLRRLVRKPEVYEADRQSVAMGIRFRQGRTPGFYGAFHAQGRGVPRRPFWRALSPSERRDWSDVVLDHLVDPLR